MAVILGFLPLLHVVHTRFVLVKAANSVYDPGLSEMNGSHTIEYGMITLFRVKSLSAGDLEVDEGIYAFRSHLSTRSTRSAVVIGSISHVQPEL
jgi:hypothetical protein